MALASIRDRVVSWACVCTAVLLVTAGVSATPPAVQVTHGVPTGSMPKGVSISPDGTRLYVANYGQLDRNNVTIFDASDLRRLGAIDVPGIVVESAVSSDGQTLFVSNFRRSSVQFIDLATRRISREVRTTGRNPKIVVLSPDGHHVFAANWSSQNVTQIDTATGQVVRTLRAGENPRGMAMTRAGTLYIANFNSHTIDVYAGAALDQHHRIDRVCRIPRHLVLSPDDATLYVSCLSLGQIVAINLQTEQVDHRVRVGSMPKAIDVSPDGRLLYSANYGGSSVSVVDTTDWTVRTLDVPLMDHASGIVSARDGVRFFVTGWYDDHLYAVGLAGAGPSFSITPAQRATTLRMREFHRLNPAE